MKNKSPEAESIITYVFAVGIPIAIFVIEIIRPGSVWGILLGLILVGAVIVYVVKSLIFDLKYGKFKSKFIDGCKYAAFCFGIFAPAGLIAFIASYLGWPGFLTSLLGFCCIAFQIYFLSKVHEYKGQKD